MNSPRKQRTLKRGYRPRRGCYAKRAGMSRNQFTRSMKDHFPIKGAGEETAGRDRVHTLSVQGYPLVST